VSAAGSTPLAPRQLLAFDYGSRRIGVASGDTLLGRARPLATVVADDARHAAIARLVAEWTPHALVVGVPRHPDGAPHRNTARAERFARELQARHALPVHLVDERYSTVEAERGDAPAPGRAGLDAAAAAVILDQFLREPTPPMDAPKASIVAVPVAPADPAASTVPPQP
jgi:putative holliday junction resolvase